jgi:hypothetical protein
MTLCVGAENQMQEEQMRKINVICADIDIALDVIVYSII